MSIVISGSSMTYSGNIKVFWVQGSPGGGEAIAAKRMAEQAARSRGYNCVGIRCGMHNYSPVNPNIPKGTKIWDEQHITANFARVDLNSPHWHALWEDNGIAGHIYTDGERIGRLELYGLRNHY